ncbi:BspA family leucine-rich repeat surface protein [Mycoplasma sp. HU2014]|uniref:BspA family leucine-rich repeat surface protein n=1 Tax=Mycoplasma sp. HU2014 TaxID=1664275 RepID=UPI00067BE1C7|nr:BspA family leucine-rich repeat surface protein [Mycoplasma sp. HU2014]KNG79344.1 PARCEL domain-containing protein [Mycoplasma sp. HU2014]
MNTQKPYKKAIHNSDFTECLEIGYFTKPNGEVQIEQFPVTVKKVPNILPPLITNLKKAFWGNKNTKIQGIENWNTENITNMSQMFEWAKIFNQDISSWDISNVTKMCYMFAETHNFNQNISSWDTSQVTDMRYMFNGAKNFNQNISNWNVSQVLLYTSFALKAPYLTKENIPPKFRRRKNTNKIT